MLLEIIASFCFKKAADAALAAIQARYDTLAQLAWARTAEKLSQKYGDQFTDIWGSRNFIEMLSSLGIPELEQSIESAKQGEWNIDEEWLAQAIIGKLSEQMPQIAAHAPELVRYFFANFTAILKEKDPEALAKRIYVLQEEMNIKLDEIHRGVQRIEAKFFPFQSPLQSLPSTPIESALKDELALSQRKRSEAVLKQCELLISKLEFDKAKQAALEIEELVLAIHEPKLLGRFYNTLAQTETWGGSNSSPAALAYLKKAERYIPESPILKVNIGTYYFNAHDLEPARSCLASVPPEQQNFSNYFNSKGLLYVHDSNRTEARNCFREAVRIEPTFWEARSNLGRLLAEAGELEEAGEVYLKLVEENPQFIPGYLGLGNIFFERANRSPVGSEDEKTYFERSKNYYGEALQAIKVLQVDERYVAKDLATILGNLGAVESALGNIADAEKHLLKSVALDAEQTSPRYNLGLFYQRLGRFEEAVIELETAIKLGRKDEMTRMNLGGMYIASYLASKKSDHLKKAEEICTALMSESGCSLALENLCSVYYLTKRNDLAKDACEKVLAKSPDCEFALGALAMYYELVGNAAKASELRARLLEINPDNFDANYELAVSYFKVARWTDAIPPLIKCTKPSLLSTNLVPNAYIRLARCYKYTKEPAKAFEIIEGGLKRCPRNPLLTREVARLAEVSPEKKPRLFVPAKKQK